MLCRHLGVLGSCVAHRNVLAVAVPDCAGTAYQPVVTAAFVCRNIRVAMRSNAGINILLKVFTTGMGHSIWVEPVVTAGKNLGVQCLMQQLRLSQYSTHCAQVKRGQSAEVYIGPGPSAA